MQRGGQIAEKHLPGELCVWMFGDLVVFGLFFVYIYYLPRSKTSNCNVHSQEAITRSFGLVNTLLLLTSSWFVATATQRARTSSRGSPTLLLLALLCGASFCVIKVFEYRQIAAGLTLNKNEFFTFYYMFTRIGDSFRAHSIATCL
jgi:nitric oxide reductase NorE protein